MTDDTSAGGQEAGSAGAQLFTLRPSTSTADVLDALRRQGISDLETFVSKVLEKTREADEEEDSPGESHDYLIFDHYVLVRDTTPQ